VPFVSVGTSMLGLAMTRAYHDSYQSVKVKVLVPISLVIKRVMRYGRPR